jgi:serine protease Do
MDRHLQRINIVTPLPGVVPMPSPQPPALPRRTLGALALASLPALLTAARPALARSGPDSFAPLVKRVMPSVVNIAVTETAGGADPFAALPPELRRRFRERFGEQRRQVSGAGSGFIIDPSGVIVTNNHVVANADSIIVSLSDGTQLRARLVGADELTDVAVIRVTPAAALPAAQWGDSQAVEVGDWVIACGNPFGLGGSVAAGIVSARGRDLGASPFDDFIQIDAPINPGNSGGPLFDTDGRVIGMNSAIFSPTGSSVGIGFAIPSELVSRIVAELRAHGSIERGWLGVSLQDPGASGHPGKGVRVVAVQRAGPAWDAGLRPGDLVIKVAGDAVHTARALVRAVAAAPPGRVLPVTIERQARDLTLSVTVGRRPKIEER